MKRGPKPSLNCPAEVHLRLSQEERDIIDSMGPGHGSEKIKILIMDYKRRTAFNELLDTQKTIDELLLKKADLQKQLRAH